MNAKGNRLDKKGRLNKFYQSFKKIHKNIWKN